MSNREIRNFHREGRLKRKRVWSFSSSDKQSEPTLSCEFSNCVLTVPISLIVTSYTRSASSMGRTFPSAESDCRHVRRQEPEPTLAERNEELQQPDALSEGNCIRGLTKIALVPSWTRFGAAGACRLSKWTPERNLFLSPVYASPSMGCGAPNTLESMVDFTPPPSLSSVFLVPTLGV